MGRYLLGGRGYPAEISTDLSGIDFFAFFIHLFIRPHSIVVTG